MLSSVVSSRTILVAACGLLLAGPARAQDASAWDSEPHGAARLIAGAERTVGGATWLRAGVELRLDPGWKTYWRYPGDSGVPPTLDFAGSSNVKAVTILWPAPHDFPDGDGGHSIGYHGKVVLPLRIAAKDAAKPAMLRIKLHYAICGKLCVPAQADLSLDLSGKAGSEEAELERAEARVPRRVALGADAAGLSIRSAHVEENNGHPRVTVDVAAPAGAPLQLFAEGPTPDWALPLPQPIKESSAEPRRFTFMLDGLPPGAHAAGATLTLTAVSGAHAIEVPIHLDSSVGSANVTAPAAPADNTVPNSQQ